VDRSFELVEGLLGILKAGGAYVPLDPRYPASRLSYIAEDSGIEVVVTTEDLRELVPGVEAVCLGSFEESEENPPSVASSEKLAYVIYTSGSTGKPKGSLITHRNVARLVLGTSYARFGSDEVFLQAAPVAFEAAVAAAEQPKFRGFELGVRASLASRSEHSRVSSPNVVGLLEGSDPALRSTYLVYSAHLDHVGLGPESSGRSTREPGWCSACWVCCLRQPQCQRARR